jgi:hypothetical protein
MLDWEWPPKQPSLMSRKAGSDTSGKYQKARLWSGRGRSSMSLQLPWVIGILDQLSAFVVGDRVRLPRVHFQKCHNHCGFSLVTPGYFRGYHRKQCIVYWSHLTLFPSPQSTHRRITSSTALTPFLLASTSNHSLCSLPHTPHLPAPAAFFPLNSM